MPESLLLVIATSFVVGLSGSVLPGPVFAVAVGEAVRRGVRYVLLLVLGHVLVDLAVVLALAGGLAGIAALPATRLAVGIVGGVFLLGFGWLTLRAGWKGDLRVEASDRSGRAPILVGVALSFLNPPFLLWWATVGASYVVWAMAIGYLGVAVFYVAHVLADFLWYGTLAALLVGGRRFVSGAVHRGLVVACGAFLLFLGLAFLRTSAALLGLDPLS